MQELVLASQMVPLLFIIRRAMFKCDASFVFKHKRIKCSEEAVAKCCYLDKNGKEIASYYCEKHKWEEDIPLNLVDYVKAAVNK